MGSAQSQNPTTVEGQGNVVYYTRFPEMIGAKTGQWKKAYPDETGTYGGTAETIEPNDLACMATNINTFTGVKFRPLSLWEDGAFIGSVVTGGSR